MCDYISKFVMILPLEKTTIRVITAIAEQQFFYIFDAHR